MLLQILSQVRLLSLVVLVGLFSASCHNLRVYVSKTLPPDFTFNVGQFAECCTDFSVFAVFEEGSEKPFWKISTKTTVQRTQANSFVIHYGQLPKGFEQETPAVGEPPPLIEGKTYVAVAGAPSYVPWARVKFIVKDNQIVTLPSDAR